MTVIDAKHEFLKRRNYYIAELMSIFDADSSILDYDIDYTGDDREERYSVKVIANKEIDFVNIEYEIVTSEY
jgi:hypothetical protein